MQTRTNARDGSTLVYVRPGKLVMGSDIYERERKHSVEITRGFWIYRYRVSFDQFQVFMRQSGFGDDDLSQARGNDVVKVTWEAADAYCRWAGVALPTEAEWEYATSTNAARGIFQRSLKRGLSAFSSRMRGEPDYELSVVPDASEASWAGAVGMADGTMREWCSDWYDEGYYRRSPGQDPQGPSRGELRSIRGGSWGAGCWENRITSRMGGRPLGGGDDVGFRPVLRAG